MELKHLLRSLNDVKVIGHTELTITGIAADSRKIVSGNLFVAVRGTTVDGHDYIQKAIEKGAAAIVCDLRFLTDQLTHQMEQAGVTMLAVENSAEA